MYIKCNKYTSKNFSHNDSALKFLALNLDYGVEKRKPH